MFRTLTFAWDPSPAPDLTGYRIRYGTKSGEYSHALDVGNLTRAEVPNLVDGTTYYFTVSALTAGGHESPPADEVVHTVNPARFLNFSARGVVQKGSDVLYSGFTIGGSTRKRVVIRALGPSLKSAGIKKPLDNPKLELRGAAGAITSNDNWRDDNRDALLASTLAPSSDREAALILTLEPGHYTAIIRGNKNATGTAVLEVYDLGTE